MKKKEKFMNGFLLLIQSWECGKIQVLKEKLLDTLKKNETSTKILEKSKPSTIQRAFSSPSSAKIQASNKDDCKLISKHLQQLKNIRPEGQSIKIWEDSINFFEKSL